MTDEQQKITREYAQTLLAIADGAEWEVRNKFGGEWYTPSSPAFTWNPIYIRLKPWSLCRTVNGYTLPPGREWHRQDWTRDMLPAPYRPLMLGENRLDENRIDEDQYFDPDSKTWEKGRGLSPMSSDHYHSRTTRPIPVKPAPVLTPEQIADGWVEWNGGECPVEPESVPAVMFIDTKKTDRKARDWSWCDNGEYDKIIAYRPDPLGPIRQAIADGNPVQWQTSVGTWTTYDKNLDTSPGWEHSRQWRIKPADIPLGPEDVPPGSVVRLIDEKYRLQWMSVCAVGCSHILIISYHIPTPTVCDMSYAKLFEEFEINRSIASGKWDPTAWEPCRKEAP